ncbi:TIGR02147 family protein [Fibrobacterota bacterium]
MKSIFEYLNYREFLRDFFMEKKQKHSFYSYRLFSEKAGFKSPNFLKLVMEKQRNLTKDSLFKVCKGLKLRKKEAEYFENLVFFNQSKTLDEKNHYLKGVMRHRKQDDPHNVEKDELKYFSKWYHPVIRELVCAQDFKADFRHLGKCVIPAISAEEAESSVKLLTELGYIEKNRDGTWIMKIANITTGPQIRSVAVSNYHREMLSLASQAIERFPASERNITSQTLSLSEESVKIVVDKIKELRKELFVLAEEDKQKGRVMQVNFQVFPLSADHEKEDET